MYPAYKTLWEPCEQFKVEEQRLASLLATVLLQVRRLLRQRVHICFSLHSSGALPGTRIGIQGEQSPLTEGWVPHTPLSVKIYSDSTATAQEVSPAHVLWLQITVKPLPYPALLDQQAPLLHGCRRLLTNGKIVLEQVKATIN